MVTTETELDQMAAALEAGANEYVMKPFTKEFSWRSSSWRESTCREACEHGPT